MGSVEVDGAAEEGDRRCRPLVAEHLDVGQAGGVVDADVDDSQPIPRACPVRLAVIRWPAPSPILTSFLTSMWISSPARRRS
ncbi:MAG: hypothetical protein M3502_03010 [Actinomycetota bacterium]|nr:hypothetical protein [Actinomycetota bacterium]